MNDGKNLPAVITNAAAELQINLEEVNLLLPTRTFGQVLGRYDRVTLESVEVDPNPDAGDVYKPSDSRGGLALGKVPLDRMSNALSVIWDPQNTGVIQSERMKSRAKATGAYRKPNGEWVSWTEEKTIDIEVYEEEQRMAYEEKAKRGNPDKVTKWGKTRSGKSYPEVLEPWPDEQAREHWIERQVLRAVLQRRKYKDELALTGAKERVLRHMVALKSSYTAEELQKPFVVPRVTTDMNKMLDDPAVRAEAMERMRGSVASIFGERREIRNVTASAAEEDGGEIDGVVVENGDGAAVPDSEDVPEEIPPFELSSEEEGEAWDETEEQVLLRKLKTYCEAEEYAVLGKAGTTGGRTAREAIRELLAKERVKIEDLRAMDERVQHYMELWRKSKNGGAE